MTPESAVLQLASFLLAKEVNPELLTILRIPGTTKALTRIEPSCSEILGKDWTDQDFEEAAVEYCRLFILNPAVPARAAAYFPEENAQEIGSRIQFMIDNGFIDLPENYRSLAPDHIALLLIIHSSLAGDDARQFHADNLAPWSDRFADALEQSAQHPLYRLAGKLVRFSS